MTSELRPENLTIATTSFYPKFDGRIEPDKIRGELAISFAEKAFKRGINLVVVDGGSTESFLNALTSRGISPIRQESEGVDKSRFQAYREAYNKTGSQIILWTEIEKVPLISNELLRAAEIISKGKAKIVVPARSETGLNSLPAYQKVSELSANAIIKTTLERYKKLYPTLFPNLPEISNIDWFFGPKMFDRSLYPEFSNTTNFWTDFIQKLNKEKPDLVQSYGYCGPLMLPVIYALHQGWSVVSYEMKSYRHPQEQTAIELKQKDLFLQKRKNQLENITLTVDYFCQHLSRSLQL